MRPAHLRFNAGHSEPPLTQRFAHAIMCSDLCWRFLSCAESNQALARKQQGGAEPVGLLLLFVGVITQKEHSGRRYFDACRGTS